MPKRLGKRSSEIFDRREMEDYEDEVIRQATFSIWTRHHDELALIVQQAKAQSGWRQVNQSMMIRQLLSIFCDRLRDIDWSNVDSERSVREAIEAKIVRTYCGED